MSTTNEKKKKAGGIFWVKNTLVRAGGQKLGLQKESMFRGETIIVGDTPARQRGWGQHLDSPSPFYTPISIYGSHLM